MKKIFRMLIFSGLALYITSAWNKGFILNLDIKNYLIATIIVAIIFYFINPIAKLVLLPINIITMGIMSLVAYILIFHFFLTHFSLIQIKEWVFTGISINGFILKKMAISYWANVCLSSLSVSFVINCLEKIL